MVLCIEAVTSLILTPPPLPLHICRWLVFGGAISALGFMTVLSVCLGFATLIIPRAITFYISTALLALFGLKMLYEGYKMDPNEGQEELEEVSEELRKREESVGVSSCGQECERLCVAVGTCCCGREESGVASCSQAAREELCGKQMLRGCGWVWPAAVKLCGWGECETVVV